MSIDVRKIATEIANEILRCSEFIYVIEHPDCEELDDEQLEEVHDLVRAAVAHIPEETE